MIDEYNRVSVFTALNPAAGRTASANGNAIDLLTNNGTNKLVFAVCAGVITDGTHTFKLQDSPDNSTWTDVPVLYVQNSGANFTSATVTGSCVKMGYLGNTNGGYRYVRLVATVATATTGGFYSAIAYLGGGALLSAV